MLYYLRTDHDGSETVVGTAPSFGEASFYRKRLQAILGQPVWITDPLTETIPDWGWLKDDYKVTFEPVPFPSGKYGHEYTVEILRRAIVVYEDGTRVRDVNLPWIPQTSWTLGVDKDPLSGTDDPILMASINTHYRQAIID